MLLSNLKQLFIFSFYFEIIIYFPKTIYSSHQEEQLKKNVLLVLPKWWWKWFKLWISVASVQMAFNIWMSNSSNRKLLPAKMSLMEVATEHIVSMSPLSFLYQQTEIHGTVTETRLWLAVSSPSVSVLLRCILSQVYPPPFEACTPAYLVKTTRQSHRSALQVRGREVFFHDMIYTSYGQRIIYVCTALRFACFSK